MNRLARVLVCISTLAVWGTASSAVIWIGDATGLTGARNVDVGGTLYDVTFVDGTCGDLFDGCDDASDLMFTNARSARAASQALLDQVFLDTPAAPGDYDSVPALTEGCSDGFWCRPATLYGIGTGVLAEVSLAVNRDDNLDAAVVTVLNRLTDTAIIASITYAVWTLSPTPDTDLPGPGTLLLTGAGLGLLVSRRRSNARRQDLQG